MRGQRFFFDVTFLIHQNLVWERWGQKEVCFNWLIFGIHCNFYIYIISIFKVF
jgi:hypothetical protein